MKVSPKIEEIRITKKQLGELSSLIKRDTLTTEVRNRIIKQYAGGVCSICGDVPSKKVTYDADGATVIERYCKRCFRGKRF
jgi:hypothetical protein